MRYGPTAFTLVELVTVIVIVVVLAAAITPLVLSSLDNARIARILDVVDSVQRACQAYHYDTGMYARELSGSALPSDHGLSMNDGSSGWNGPYLNRPLIDTDNPYHALAVVGMTGLVQVSQWLGEEYDLDFDGSADRQGAGNEIMLRPVPIAAIVDIDTVLDPGVNQAQGRVEWISNFSPVGALYVYLIGGTGN